MHLDIAEIHRISERLGALDMQGKMLVSYIAVQAEDRKICSEIGFMPHQLQPAINALCTELHMSHLERWNWRGYIRAATLLLVAPEKPGPPPPKKKWYRIKKKTLKEVEPFIARYIREGQRTKDPLLSAMFLQVPYVFGLAISLCRNVDQAEELVQEGLVRAYANLSSFQPGANLKVNVRAWLCTIVKNFYETERRKQKYTVSDPEGILAGTLKSLPDQLDTIELREVEEALERLPIDQRQAVVLAGLGYSYGEIASAADCAEGTVKSRINRGRTLLSALTDKDLVQAAE